MNLEIHDVPKIARLDERAIREFILAGRARFTVKNPATGNRFTYRVRAKKDGRVWFVSVLSGPNNEQDYRYLGVIVPNPHPTEEAEPYLFHLTRKSQIGKEAPSYKAFAWLWFRLARDLPLNGVEVWHEGRCGHCGRTLTVPESIATGIGPVCAGRG